MQHAADSKVSQQLSFMYKIILITLAIIAIAIIFVSSNILQYKRGPPTGNRSRHSDNPWARVIQGFLVHESINVQNYLVITNETEDTPDNLGLEELIGLGRNQSRNVTDYLSDGLDSFEILPKSICATDNFVLNFIASAPNYFHRRAAIRDTWAEARPNVSTYFVVGVPANAILQEIIIRESEKYDDIIQENFLDTFNNLTLKSIAILKVVDKLCANRTKYIFKVDDDVYVNMNLLLDYLASNQKEDLLAGRISTNMLPNRNYKYKWYCPLYLFNSSVYPPYLRGYSYVMSVNVARTLYKTALQTPLFHIEDVFLTGICAKIANISLTHDSRFSKQSGQYAPCQIGQLFSMHRRYPSQMVKLYNLMQDKTSMSTCPPLNETKL